MKVQLLLLNMMIDMKSRITASKNLLHCTVNGEAVILSMESGIYFGLDNVGVRIWELIQEPTTMNLLLEKLLSEYDVDPNVCRDHLVDFINDLHSRELIEVLGK